MVAILLCLIGPTPYFIVNIYHEDLFLKVNEPVIISLMALITTILIYNTALIYNAIRICKIIARESTARLLMGF